jgi:hypothetical protein
MELKASPLDGLTPAEFRIGEKNLIDPETFAKYLSYARTSESFYR